MHSFGDIITGQLFLLVAIELLDEDSIPGSLQTSSFLLHDKHNTNEGL